MNGEDLQRALGRVEGELKGLRQSVEAIAENHEQRLTRHDGKIRSLELWRAALAGGGAVVLSLLGYLLWVVNFWWGK